MDGTGSLTTSVRFAVRNISEKHFSFVFLGDNPSTVYLYGTAILSLTVSTATIAFYLSMDISLTPESLRKYKLQEGTNEPVDLGKVWKVSEHSQRPFKIYSPPPTPLSVSICCQ